MDDEQKQLRAVDRASKARALIENELLVEAFKTVEADYYELWKSTKDVEARERIWQASNLIEKVQAHLASVLRNGTAAKAILKDIEGKRRQAA